MPRAFYVKIRYKKATGMGLGRHIYLDQAVRVNTTCSNLIMPEMDLLWSPHFLGQKRFRLICSHFYFHLQALLLQKKTLFPVTLPEFRHIAHASLRGVGLQQGTRNPRSFLEQQNLPIKNQERKKREVTLLAWRHAYDKGHNWQRIRIDLFRKKRRESYSPYT